MELVRHLRALGHKRIALFGLGPADRYSGDRYLGYVDGLREMGEMGVEKAPAVIRTPGFFKDPDMVLSYANALQAAAADGCTAVMATSDIMAIGCMRALKSAGYAVPRDISVTGFDDIVAGKVVEPPLTTMREESEVAASAIIEMVMCLLEGKGPQQSRSVPMTLVVRGSTGPAKRG